MSRYPMKPIGAPINRRHKECLWLSPACIDSDSQLSLFDNPQENA